MRAHKVRLSVFPIADVVLRAVLAIGADGPHIVRIGIVFAGYSQAKVIVPRVAKRAGVLYIGTRPAIGRPRIGWFIEEIAKARWEIPHVQLIGIDLPDEH